MRTKTTSILGLFLLAGCGVEVGKPADGAPKVFAVPDQSISVKEDGRYRGRISPKSVQDDKALSHPEGYVYKIDQQPAKGVASILNAENGKYEYVPRIDAFGEDTFSIAIERDGFEPFVAHIAVTILPEFDPPQAGDLTLVIKEDEPVTSTVPFTYVDDGVLAFTVVVDPAKGAVALNALTGEFTYTPTADAFGGDSFFYAITAPNGDVATAGVIMSITPVQDAMTIDTPVIAVTEDVPLSDVLGFTEVDKDDLTFAVVTPPAKGTMTFVDVTLGTFVFTPTANAFGSDQVVLKVTDELGNSTTTAVPIAIAGVPDAPVARSFAVTTDEDTVYEGALDFSEVDDDAVTHQITVSPLKGVVTILAQDSGQFRYVPNANANGPDTFRYKTSDDGGVSWTAEATATVTITPINDVPVGDSTPGSNHMDLDEDDIAQSGDLPLGSDVDSASLTYVVDAMPTKGVLNLTDAVTGAFTFTPNLNAYGADSFTYKISDGIGLSAAVTFTISIAGGPDDPVATAQTFYTYPNENPAPSGTLVGSDPDGDTIEFIDHAAATIGTIVIDNPVTGAFHWDTPGGTLTGPDGTYQFKTRETNDNVGDDAQIRLSTATTVTLKVLATPTATGAAFSVAECAAEPCSLYVGDGGGNPLLAGTADIDGPSPGKVFAIVTAPTKGVATITNVASGAFTYKLNAGGTGSDSFTFRVGDGHGFSPIRTMTITIVDAPPTANAASLSVYEDAASPASGTLTGSDPDNEPLKFANVSSTGLGSGVTIGNVDTGAISWVHGGAAGTGTFVFKVTNQSPPLTDSASATLTLRVLAVPTAINQSPAAFNEDTDLASESLSGAVDASKTRTYQIVAAPTKGSISALNTTSGAYTYHPNADANGADSFTYRTSDGTRTSLTRTVTLAITPTADAPRAVGKIVNGTEDVPINDTLAALTPGAAGVIAPDGDALTYCIVASGTKGTINLTAATGAFTFTPAANAFGTDIWNFKGCTGGSCNGTCSNTSLMQIVIGPVNDAPTAYAQSVDVEFGQPRAIELTGTDPDLDSLTYSIVTSPTKGTLNTASLPNVIYTRTVVSDEDDTFTYRVSDGTLQSVAKTVRVISWWNPSWQYRRKLTFDNGNYEALSDFPVLVKLDPTRIDYGDVLADGSDLRFIDIDGTELNYDIETWVSGGTSFVWVRVPRIDGLSSVDHIWMYYGNPGASAPGTAAARSTWSTRYDGVWHMTDVRDSTANEHHGNVDARNPSSTTGEISGAKDFNRSASERISLSDGGYSHADMICHAPRDDQSAQTFTSNEVDTAGNIIAIPGNPFVIGTQKVRVSGTGIPGGLVAGTDYYPVSATAAGMQLSLTVGGAAVDIINTGTAGNTFTLTPQVGATGNFVGTVTAVDTATERLSLASNDFFQTGQQVRVASTGTYPTGLAAATTYVVLDSDATSFQLATTGAPTTPINLTTTGSGTITVYIQTLSSADRMTTRTFLPSDVDTAADTVTIYKANGAGVAPDPHRFYAGMRFFFRTTGTLPGATPALSVVKNYYVVNPSADKFQFAATPGGAAIDLTSAGTGTQLVQQEGLDTFFTNAEVDTLTDVIVTSSDHGFAADQLVRIVTDGTMPGGLESTRDYWLTPINANSFKLALHQGDENNPVNITSAGSGNFAVLKSRGIRCASLVQGVPAITLSAWVNVRRYDGNFPMLAISIHEVGDLSRASFQIEENIRAVAAADVSIANDTLKFTSHGLQDDDPVHMRGANLPAPLARVTTYYVIKVDEDYFQLAATPGGSAINLTSQGAAGTQVYPEAITWTFPTTAVDTVGDKITITNHGFVDGELIHFQSSTTLPTGIATSTGYYVKKLAGNDDFQLLTSNNAGASVVNISTVGAGTHAIYRETFAKLNTFGRSQDADSAIGHLTQGSPLPVGQWAQIVSIIDYFQGLIVTYVNGEFNSFSPVVYPKNSSPPDYSWAQSIGSQDQGTSSFVDAKIDEIRVVKESLSSDFIKADYRSQKDDNYVEYGNEASKP